ncbi:hypothetical protein V5R04_07205 [Jonesiaceae bacterium BS-20]|uniref:Uncharacterized protein n=1 Tax=Jonesiaceae bacterium BS-20 TaxID=3120821 RepID=A0AAU7DZ59_9MICO
MPRPLKPARKAGLAGVTFAASSIFVMLMTVSQTAGLPLLAVNLLTLVPAAVSLAFIAGSRDSLWLWVSVIITAQLIMPIFLMPYLIIAFAGATYSTWVRSAGWRNWVKAVKRPAQKMEGSHV